MSMNKSFRTLTVTTAVALLTFGVAAYDSSTVGSSEVASSTTMETSTMSPSTKASAPKPGEKSASEIMDPQAKRVDEAPDEQMKLSETDDSYLGALGKAGINIDGVEDWLVGTGRAACADAPEEERQVIALAVTDQLVTQDRSQDSAEEMAKTIVGSTERTYC